MKNESIPWLQLRERSVKILTMLASCVMAEDQAALRGPHKEPQPVNFELSEFGITEGVRGQNSVRSKCVNCSK